MNILNELQMLSEAKGKNLIGLTIGGKKITKQTPSEHWPGNFGCSDNQLTSLEGAPASVGGNFYCSDNQLTSLEGAPASVGGYFGCSSNRLTSLEGIHKILKQMNGIFYANNNPLKSNVIGLLLVKGCKEVELDNRQVQEIMNRHLPNTKGHLGLLECQEELLSAEFIEWAKL